jgi:hypothetical protein
MTESFLAQNGNTPAAPGKSVSPVRVGWSVLVDTRGVADS